MNISKVAFLWLFSFCVCFLQLQAMGQDATSDAYNDSSIYSVDSFEDKNGNEDSIESEIETKREKEEQSIFALPAGIRPSVKSWVDRKKLKLGETLNFEVVVHRRVGHEVRLPSNVSFGKLDLLEKTMKNESQTKDGWTNDHYTFTLIALEAGAIQIPSIRFAVVTKGGDVFYMDTIPLEIAVADPSAGKVDPPIKDLAGVVKVYERNTPLLIFLGSLVLVFFVLVTVWYVARNWERWHPKAPKPAPPPRPPEEIAYEKLEVLKAKLPLQLDLKKSWYLDLSFAIREYLSNRFDFDGLECTSEEIIDIMKTKKTVGITQAELWKFLFSCDMVKFAKHVPSDTEDREMIDEAFRIVDVTNQNYRVYDEEIGKGKNGIGAK